MVKVCVMGGLCRPLFLSGIFEYRKSVPDDQFASRRGELVEPLVAHPFNNEPCYKGFLIPPLHSFLSSCKQFLKITGLKKLRLLIC